MSISKIKGNNYVRDIEKRVTKNLMWRIVISVIIVGAVFFTAANRF